ncbi:MAG: hypothetical protein V7709_08435 [Halioglobus sp.]
MMKLTDLGGDMPFINDLGILPKDDYMTTMAMGEEDTGGFVPPSGDGCLGNLHASITEQLRSNLTGVLPGTSPFPGLKDL